MASTATNASRKPFAWNNFGQLQSVFDAATNETTTYSYDLYGNLLAVALPDGRTIEYEVDGAGRRVGRREFDADGNEVSFRGWIYRDLLRPIAEVDELGNVVARYIYEDGDGARQNGVEQLSKRMGADADVSLSFAGRNVPHFIEVIDGAGSVIQTLALTTSQVGSVQLVTDASTGEVLQRLEYDDFGRIAFDSEPGLQPFGFAGGLQDPATGLVRFGARDLDPTVGRWISRDPLRMIDGENLMLYGQNDPINWNDPEGLFKAWWDAFWCWYHTSEMNDDAQECEEKVRRDWSEKPWDEQLEDLCDRYGDGQPNQPRSPGADLQKCKQESPHYKKALKHCISASSGGKPPLRR